MTNTHAAPPDGRYPELHVERLLGCRVHDRDGKALGRLEEIRVEEIDGELVAVEFHIGAQAIVERLGGFALQLPFFNRLPVRRFEYRLSWRLMDFSDPRRPRVTCRREELEQVNRGE
jgi:hypothetical protein